MRNQNINLTPLFKKTDRLILLGIVLLTFYGCDFMSDESRLKRKAKRIHQRVLTIDTHTDTPLQLVRYDVDLETPLANLTRQAPDFFISWPQDTRSINIRRLTGGRRLLIKAGTMLPNGIMLFTALMRKW